MNMRQLTKLKVEIATAEAKSKEIGNLFSQVENILAKLPSEEADMNFR